MNCRLLVSLVLCSGITAQAQLITKLTPETTKAFTDYVSKAEPDFIAKAKTDSVLPLLGNASVDQVRRGEILLKGDSREVPGGMIHDWTGATFFENATTKQVASLLQDFARHQQWYPEIIASRLVTRDGNNARGTWTIKKKKVLTVVLRTDLDSEYREVSPGSGYLVSRSDQVVELEHHGSDREVDYPAGQGHGFLWRFNGYWTLHQQAGGVFAECRIVSLSRDIPAGLNMIIAPFVKSMPRESLETTLRETRDALKKLTAST